jgi:hypothetical protein
VSSLKPEAEEKSEVYPFEENTGKELIASGMYRASDIPIKRSDIDWSNIDKHYESSESSGVMKTLRYTQSRVHDFAWFADKTFRVLKGEVI